MSLPSSGELPASFTQQIAGGLARVEQVLVPLNLPAEQ
tara:strand:- start:9370 stop:9483 length:114 start_codon:yes stop_codon:yes gene_type:complete